MKIDKKTVFNYVIAYLISALLVVSIYLYYLGIRLCKEFCLCNRNTESFSFNPFGCTCISGTIPINITRNISFG